MRIRFALLSLLAFLSAHAAAASLTVEGAVSPAWVERAGAREPLAVGMTLSDNDRVVTGAGSRALLRLADGSAVRLGENAALSVSGLSEKTGDRARRFVTASLDVARGAFRFTTGVFSKLRAERDVTIRVATVTAGVRGTDLWGKSDAERDLVCLIEGRISVAHAQTGEFTMSDPLAFFVAPRGKPPLPVGKVDPEQLKQWAQETELDAAPGAARRGGRFAVLASVNESQADALRDYDRLRAAGYPATIQPVRSEAGVEYRVRIASLPGEKEAAAVVRKLKVLGLAQAVLAR
ncbi:MAG: FecR domain-containing protein [Burkholderiales bacterium]|nr:FecR domain-containing protein [Burkholderiales bacterium]